MGNRRGCGRENGEGGNSSERHRLNYTGNDLCRQKYCVPYIYNINIIHINIRLLGTRRLYIYKYIYTPLTVII